MNSGTKISFRRVFYTILGIMILGAGIALMVRAGLGTSPLDVLIEMIHFKVGMTVGRVTFIAQILMMVVTLVLYPKNIGIGTLLALVLTQFPIDLVYSLVQTSDIFYIDLMMSCFGAALTSLGSALIIHNGLGMGTYEALTFSISYHFDIRYLYVKYTLDAVFLILLVLMHGTIGVGTLISYLFIGRMIVIFMKLLEKIIVFGD